MLVGIFCPHIVARKCSVEDVRLHVVLDPKNSYSVPSCAQAEDLKTLLVMDRPKSEKTKENNALDHATIF
jgi:hypothetical protein